MDTSCPGRDAPTSGWGFFALARRARILTRIGRSVFLLHTEIAGSCDAGKQHVLFCLSVLIIASTAVAQSKQPPFSAGEQQQTQPNPDQQPAAQPPITVNVLPAPKSDGERAEEVCEREEKAELDRRLVKFTADLAAYTERLYYATLAVAIATVCLVLATAELAVFAFFQSRDMKDSVAVARRSADIARDALITTERAFVYLDDFDTDLGYASRGASLEFSLFVIKPRWRNSGTTPTRNMTIIINWTSWNGDLPDGFSYAYGEGVKPSPMFLAPQATEWE